MKPQTALSGQPADPLSFPAELIPPRQTALSRSEDAVANAIVKFDGWGARLGEAFGVTMTDFTLNPPEAGKSDLAAFLIVLAHRAERVTLERRGGRWGLYFTRDPMALSQDRKADVVLLKDAPLDVRERFLARSEEFFRQYLGMCEARLGGMKRAVDKADQTLALLENMKLT